MATTVPPITTTPAEVITTKFAVPFSMPRGEDWAYTETGDFVAEMGNGIGWLVFTTAGRPDVAGWIEKLTTDPALVATAPVEAEIGSASGFVVDIELSEEATAGVMCGHEPCVELFAFAPTPDANYGWVIYSGFRERVWALDVGGETVAIFAEAPASSFEEWAAEVDEALARLEWTNQP